PYVLCSFTKPEVNGQLPVEKQCCHNFNKHLSSQCITVEHTFEMMESHFPSLKDLLPEHDIHDTYCVVETLLTLYNLCINLGDYPEYIPFFDNTDPDRDNK
ncbi:uncharacterized protein F5147DRAFT_554294, partial [Suillus discolor]